MMFKDGLVVNKEQSLHNIAPLSTFSDDLPSLESNKKKHLNNGVASIARNNSNYESRSHSPAPPEDLNLDQASENGFRMKNKTVNI